MAGGNTVAEGTTNDELAVDNPGVEVVAKSDQSQAEPGFIGIGDSRPEKVLLVDDSETTPRIIENLLQKLGYRNIVEAEDGGDGYIKTTQYRV
jgi:PleD family two-component response regulator